MTAFKMSAFLWLLAGYLVIGYSFMLLRVPPVGAGVPIGEVFLCLYLATTDLPRTLSRLAQAMPITPLLLFWCLGLVRLAIGAVDNGAWAFRDASHFLNSLYIIVGFSLAAKRENWERLWRWLPWILLAASLNSFTFIYGDEIRAASPTISGGSGQIVPIFGAYASSANLLLLTAIYLMVYRTANFRGALIIAITCIAFGVIVFQARTIYFQIIAIFLLLAACRREALPRAFAFVPMLLLAIAVIVATGIKVPGRLSDQISFSFFIEHFGASFGFATSRELIGAADGVDLRLNWWHDILQQLGANPISALTGLGYGIPLTHFINAEGVLVREPHNSVISMLSRLGIFGLLTFIAASGTLVLAAVESMRACRRQGWRLWEDRLLVFFGYFVITLVMAMTEDAFEKPYLTIPYYAFWGFVLRFRYETRRMVQESKRSGWPAQAAIASAAPPLPATE